MSSVVIGTFTSEGVVVEPGYAFESHTADIALECWGNTVGDVFEQAALAMVGLMYDVAGIDPDQERLVELEAPDRELLLAAWLNELIFLFEAEAFLGCRFLIETLEDRGPRNSHLRAKVAGASNARGRYVMRDVVKAATLHDLHVARVKDGWLGHVLLDV